MHDLAALRQPDGIADFLVEHGLARLLVPESGEEIVVVQIAGLVARRIVTETSRGEKLEQGSRIGMIRFGSRAELYFENYKPLVKIDQRAIAGET